MNFRLLAFSAALAALLAFTGCASRPERARPAATAPGAQALRVLEPAERPGLGTGWGEQRESWVEPAYFARAWEDRPSGTDKLYYNDREGVEAMTDYLGGEPRSVSGLQR